MGDDEIGRPIVFDLSRRLPKKDRDVSLLGLQGDILHGVFGGGRPGFLVNELWIRNSIPWSHLDDDAALDLLLLLDPGGQIEPVRRPVLFFVGSNENLIPHEYSLLSGLGIHSFFAPVSFLNSD